MRQALESNWCLSNRHMLERLPMRNLCTEQWRHMKDSIEPSFDINTSLAKVSTSKLVAGQEKHHLK